MRFSPGSVAIYKQQGVFDPEAIYPRLQVVQSPDGGRDSRISSQDQLCGVHDCYPVPLWLPASESRWIYEGLVAGGVVLKVQLDESFFSDLSVSHKSVSLSSHWTVPSSTPSSSVAGTFHAPPTYPRVCAQRAEELGNSFILVFSWYRWRGGESPQPCLLLAPVGSLI